MLVRRGNAGFTLVEVLVAAGLVSVVLALALKGFTEAKKIADITKAKVIAEEEASLGAQKLAKLMRRLHVIYFDARPLLKIDTDPTAVGNLTSIRAGSPPGWLTGGTAIPGLGVPEVFLGTTTNDNYRSPVSIGIGPMVAGSGVARSAFWVRHLTDSDGTEDAAVTLPARRLKSGERKMPGNADLDFAFDRFFTSPLMYGAEATFDAAAPVGGVTQDAHLPMTWTFYLAYLAPMRFDANDAGHALFPVQETDATKSPLHQRDQGNSGWVRATIPYELRLLTIPDVRAVNITAADPDAPADPTNATLTSRIGLLKGRRIDAASVLSFPFDVKKDKANYDPIPLRATAANYADMTQTGNAYYGDASFARVAGPSTGTSGYIHGNWDNVGNDPPTQEALTNRAHWNGTAFDAVLTPITDTLLARYVDPDAVHGTFVRLANEQDLINELETKPRPYLNAYGGPQKYNPQWWAGANPTTSAPPRRGLVSVATRFRFSRQHPFSFSTESIEVDLDTLVKFQDMSFRKRR